MEWLRKLLKNAVYGEDGKLDIEETMKKVNNEAPNHVVPKEQYNSKINELNTANGTIEDLKKNNADNETLQATIKTHEETIKKLKEDHESELKNLKIDSAITRLLADHKAKHPDLLAGKFDREKLKVTEAGEVIGLDDQMKAFKETYKDLFEDYVQVKGRSPKNPDTPGAGNPTFEALVNRADTMTAEEVAAQFAAMEKQ